MSGGNYRKGIMNQERSLFFRTDDRPLYGRIYSPSRGRADNPGGNLRGLVICDSLFEEKFWCERVFANLARRLASEGMLVISFDYHGYGNSPGDSGDVSLSGLESDIGSACDLLRSEGAGVISLLGIRWGAVPACRAASARDDVDSLFLANPVNGWRGQIMKALRANVAGQYSIFKKAVMTREKIIEELLAGGDCVRSGYRMNNIDGYVLSRKFFEESADAVLPPAFPAHIKKVTVITIPERQAGEETPEDPLAAGWRAAGVDCEGVTIDGDNAFWINNRIFTSTTPGFFGEMQSRMKALEMPPPGPAPKPAVIVSESFSSGGVVEKAVDVHSISGHDLCAVLYLPVKRTGIEGFVFTHGGLIGMNGAFRFNTRAARRLAEAGYPCICCDTRGMGRSTGVMDNQEQRVLFREICAGLFAPDVESAALLLKRESGAAKAVLFGVCGGAITNILAHSRYDDIDASVLLSIPVMLPSLDYGQVRMSEGYARFYLGLYLRKIFNPKAWLRFLTGRSEMDVIFKSVRVASGSVLRKITGRKTRDDSGRKSPAEGLKGSAEAGELPKKTAPGQVKSGLSVAVPGAGDNLQFNRAFLDAWRKIVSRGEKLFFVFGEHDNFKWEFNSEFVEAMPDEYAAGREFVRVDEIPHANHMYTLREWQDSIIDRCIEWVSGA